MASCELAAVPGMYRTEYYYCRTFWQRSQATQTTISMWWLHYRVTMLQHYKSQRQTKQQNHSTLPSTIKYDPSPINLWRANCHAKICRMIVLTATNLFLSTVRLTLLPKLGTHSNMLLSLHLTRFTLFQRLQQAKEPDSDSGNCEDVCSIHNSTPLHTTSELPPTNKSKSVPGVAQQSFRSKFISTAGLTDDGGDSKVPSSISSGNNSINTSSSHQGSPAILAKQVSVCKSQQVVST